MYFLPGLQVQPCQDSLNHWPWPWQDSAHARAGVWLLRTVPSLSHPSTPSNSTTWSFYAISHTPAPALCLPPDGTLTDHSYLYKWRFIGIKQLTQLPRSFSSRPGAQPRSTCESHARLCWHLSQTSPKPVNTTLIANGLHCKRAAAAKAPKKQAGDDPKSISHACKRNRHPTLFCLEQVALAYRPELSSLGL